ncbi:hypothetical protein IB270_07665 [Ensifer sp. ENS05]|uniref:hypothetical protein n=1 Tax=Ensifer sp. ENS05 TaxID=2769277 RepID=UPI0017858BEC|nr:hypothetical protein [Ensifer sp. ENS05]MBD9592706.1 hypothetical protein [Ensifer sp. ENS05]
MIAVTSDHIDTVYDATQTMRLFSQVLSGGEIDDRMANEMLWLLGSLKRRLDPIINLLEEVQTEQEKAGSERRPSGAKP